MPGKSRARVCRSSVLIQPQPKTAHDLDIFELISDILKTKKRLRELRCGDSIVSQDNGSEERQRANSHYNPSISYRVGFSKHAGENSCPSARLITDRNISRRKFLLIGE